MSPLAQAQALAHAVELLQQLHDERSYRTSFPDSAFFAWRNGKVETGLLIALQAAQGALFHVREMAGLATAPETIEPQTGSQAAEREATLREVSGRG